MIPTPLLHRLISAELSPAKSRALVEALGTSPHLDPTQLPFLTEIDRRRIAQADESRFAQLQAEGVELVGREELPSPVGEVPFAPLGLYFWGDRSVLERPRVAIVGTRRANGYGRAVAYKFGQLLAEAGVTVLSGGALGIDAEAHRGALEAGGKTAAFLITGINQVYPATHGALYRSIRQQGCLVTQFAPGTGDRPYHPLSRNQILAAYAQAVIVVQAPLKSGALNTAEHAFELGVPVFAVPGPIDHPQSAGSNRLIQEGALLCTHPNEVMAEIGHVPVAVTSKEDPEEGDPVESVLTLEPQSLEKLVEKTGLSYEDVLSRLTDLELEGRAVRVEGRFAKRL